MKELNKLTVRQVTNCDVQIDPFISSDNLLLILFFDILVESDNFKSADCRKRFSRPDFPFWPIVSQFEIPVQ